MYSCKEKIVSKETGQSKVSEWKKQGEVVVFTNGCFDILHLGHVDYLEKAAQKGSKLVIGLNTDASIQRIKGAERPIVPQNSRARVISALEFVDLVILFDENTPYELIKLLEPSILIKGSDYLAENIVGADIVLKNGGKVETIDLVEGYSTTQIINKIKSLV